MTHAFKTPFALTTLALLGLAVPQGAYAQGTTTLFSDNFGNTAQTTVTSGASDPTRMGGTLYDPAAFSYVDNTGDTVGAIITTTPGPVINGGTLVIGPANVSGLPNAGYASPNFSFGTGNNVTFSFDMLAATTDGSALPSDNNWAGLFFGNSTNAGLVHSNVNTIDGLGLIFRNNGGYLLFDNKSSAGTPTGTSWGTPGTVTNVKLNLNDTNTAAPVVTVYINNSATPLFTYTRNTPLLGGYMGLTTSNTTAVEQFGFDNLAVTTPAAAPEPSQTAALGLAGLFLSALALKARKRSSLAA